MLFSRDISNTDDRRQQHPPPFYTVMQPASKPRKIRPDNEFFEPFPPYCVLLSSPHRCYLTKANHVYNTLKIKRSLSLNVLTEVKEPLHVALKQLYGERVPDPTFWIGADRVLAMDAWKVIPGTQRTFAIGRHWEWCYTVFQASDRCIVDEYNRNVRQCNWQLADVSDVGFAGNASPREQAMDSPRTNDSVTTLDSQELTDVIHGSNEPMSISAANEHQHTPRSPSINPSLGFDSDAMSDPTIGSWSGRS